MTQQPILNAITRLFEQTVGKHCLLASIAASQVVSAAAAEPVFLECTLPNVASSEFLIDTDNKTVLNSQEYIDPIDNTTIPSFSVQEVATDHLILTREWDGLRHRKRGRIKEMIYINRYNLRATYRVWLNREFIEGGDGTCRKVKRQM